eukprot:g13189.t1
MPRKRHGTRLADLFRCKSRKVRTGVSYAGTGKEIVTDPEHTHAIDTRPAFTQVIATPAPSKTVLQGTSYFNFILENTSAGAMDDMMIRFKIKFGAGYDHRVMPTTQWFERIEWYDRLTGTELARVYGDTMHMSLMSLSEEELFILRDMVNVDPKTGRHSHRTWMTDDEEYFFLPLLHQWISKMNLDLSALRGDIELRFYPRGNIHVYKPQNARMKLRLNAALVTEPVVTLEEMRLMQNVTLLSNGLKLGHHYPPGFVPEQRFIDWVQYVDYGRTLDAGKEFRVQLDQFSHKSGALFVMLRRSGLQNVTGARDTAETIYPLEGSQLFVCEALGDKATIDYEDIQGRSLMGEGTPIDEKYLRKNTLPEIFNQPSRKNTNTYIIPFSNDLKNMIHGDMDGYRVLRGDRESIKIVTDAAPRPTYDAFAFTQPTTDTKTVFSFMYKKKPIAQFEVKVDAKAGVITARDPVDDDTTVTLDNHKYPKYTIGTIRGLKHAAAIINQHKALQDDGVQIALYYSGTGTVNDTKTWVLNTPTVNGTYALVVEYQTLDGQPLVVEKGEIGTSRSMEVFEGAAVTDIYSSSQIGRRGFNPGLYDIYVYSAYFRYLHLVDGRLEAAAA